MMKVRKRAKANGWKRENGVRPGTHSSPEPASPPMPAEISATDPDAYDTEGP
jgi:hypothetical protein